MEGDRRYGHRGSPWVAGGSKSRTQQLANPKAEEILVHCECSPAPSARPPAAHRPGGDLCGPLRRRFQFGHFQQFEFHIGFLSRFSQRLEDIGIEIIQRR